MCRLDMYWLHAQRSEERGCKRQALPALFWLLAFTASFAMGLPVISEWHQQGTGRNERTAPGQYIVQCSNAQQPVSH